jgi:hypothetical protein
MKKNISILLSTVSIIYIFWLIYTGFTAPETLHYPQMFVLIGLLASTSYFIIFGAFEDVDKGNAK